MHGTDSQWLPVTCHSTGGIGLTGPGYSVTETDADGGALMSDVLALSRKIA